MALTELNSLGIKDGEVKTADIAADAVTGAKIADDQIDSEHYVDGSIDTAHIADDAVTLAKLASGTDGQIISWDASGNPVAIGPGTDGQVLTSTGAGSPPAFEAASAGATLSGSTNNTIVTVTGADAMIGETNLTFDGNHLAQTIDASGEGFNQTASGNHSIINEVDSNRSAADNDIRVDTAKWNGTAVTEIHHVSGADTTNKDDGYITFGTAAAGSVAEQMRIDSAGRVMIGTTTPGYTAGDDLTIEPPSGSGGITIRTGTSDACKIYFADGTSGDTQYRGSITYDHNTDELSLASPNGNALTIETDKDVTIEDGDLIIGTAGHGIDFSASADDDVTPSSELLDDYEEGDWDISLKNSGTLHSANNRGAYTRIGRVIHVTGEFRVDSDNGNSALKVDNLPFSCGTGTDSGKNAAGAVVTYDHNFEENYGIKCYVSEGSNDLNFKELRDNSSYVDALMDSGSYYAFQITYFI